MRTKKSWMIACAGASLVALVLLVSACSHSAISSQSSAPADEKAAILAEIARIRAGLSDGSLVFDYSPGSISGFPLPSDPQTSLDALESATQAPDVYMYLKDSALPAEALRHEVAAMPQVAKVYFKSKEEALAELKEDLSDNPEILDGLVGNPIPATLEIWLTDYRQAREFIKTFRDRPEVDNATARRIDLAEWLRLLQNCVHPK